MNPYEFIASLKQQLDRLVLDERTLLVDFHPGYVPGPTNGYVDVTFVNLPFERTKQRRGGGAEAENNRQLFFVRGFGSDPSRQAGKVRVEQLVSNVRGVDRLRTKTASPEKIASYLADYVNQAASQVAPYYSHEERS